MERINRFLRLRPNSKKKSFILKNKIYTFTQKEIKNMRNFKNNKSGYSVESRKFVSDRKYEFDKLEVVHKNRKVYENRNKKDDKVLNRNENNNLTDFIRKGRSIKDISNFIWQDTQISKKQIKISSIPNNDIFTNQDIENLLLERDKKYLEIENSIKIDNILKEQKINHEFKGSVNLLVYRKYNLLEHEIFKDFISKNMKVKIENNFLILEYKKNNYILDLFSFSLLRIRNFIFFRNSFLYFLKDEKLVKEFLYSVDQIENLNNLKNLKNLKNKKYLENDIHNNIECDLENDLDSNNNIENNKKLENDLENNKKLENNNNIEKNKKFSESDNFYLISDNLYFYTIKNIFYKNDKEIHSFKGPIIQLKYFKINDNIFLIARVTVNCLEIWEFNILKNLIKRIKKINIGTLITSFDILLSKDIYDSKNIDNLKNIENSKNLDNSKNIDNLKNIYDSKNIDNSKIIISDINHTIYFFYKNEKKKLQQNFFINFISIFPNYFIICGKKLILYEFKDFHFKIRERVEKEVEIILKNKDELKLEFLGKGIFERVLINKE